jgi:hypothetical protein
MIPAPIAARRMAERRAYHQQTRPRSTWTQDRRRFAAETLILRRHFGMTAAEAAEMYPPSDRETIHLIALADDPAFAAATIARYTQEQPTR